jgi:hypothetical protein
VAVVPVPSKGDLADDDAEVDNELERDLARGLGVAVAACRGAVEV